MFIYADGWSGIISNLLIRILNTWSDDAVVKTADT